MIHNFNLLDDSLGKESSCSARDREDTGLIPGSGRSSGGRKWQPTPVFLTEKSNEQRSVLGHSPKSQKESDMTEWLSMHACKLLVSNFFHLIWLIKDIIKDIYIYHQHSFEFYSI